MDSSASILIDRPPEEVYEFVMNVPNDAQWRTGVVGAAFVRDAPLDVGSSGYDTVRVNGREVRAEWEVYEVVPGVLARWNLTSGPISGTGGYVCEPEADHTRFTLEANVGPVGRLRLLGPLFGFIGRRQNRKDVSRLKRVLEAATVPRESDETV